MPYLNAEFTMEGYNRLIYDELDYKIPELIIQHEAFHRSLSNEHKGIYETILDACNNNTGGMIFVYGYGGTGKTFLYKTLTASLRSKGHIVLNVSSSGIASLLHDGGRTAHSRFAIPINIVEDSMCTISADSDLAELIRETKLIIWNEAPMINMLAYEAFDRTLRDICSGNFTHLSDNVFGGKVVVFGGDFRQILRVIPNGSEGKIGGKNDCHAEVEFPKEMLLPDLDDHVNDVIKETYDNWEEKLWDPTYFQDRAILAPTHEQVDKVNERMMSKLPSREKVCYSSDSMSDVDIDFNYDESMYTTDKHNKNFRLKSNKIWGFKPVVPTKRGFTTKPTPIKRSSDNIIKNSCLRRHSRLKNKLVPVCPKVPPHNVKDPLENEFVLRVHSERHKLVLKIGAPVMCLRNIDQRGGLCNGTRLQIVRMGVTNIEEKIISSSKVVTVVAIPRMNISTSDKKMPFQLNRRQYPIAVCFAMKINK
ncbi:ATP-dependent DNA helicase PIF1-like protein, partial [Tanacetum coccineum]